MTNNLKAERALTAEELQVIIAAMAGEKAKLYIHRLRPEFILSMASMALQSLSTQQPMGEPVAWIEKDALAALQSDKTARTSVCSGLLRKPFGDKVPLYALHPNQESGE